MTVPFGFSVGDFVAAIGVVHDIIDALQTTAKSTARYKGLLYELWTLNRALIEVKDLKFDKINPPQLDALRCAAAQCQTTIDNLLKKVQKYQSSLTAAGSGAKWKDVLRKVQWALLTDSDIEKFRAEIRGHSSSIIMLLITTQMGVSKIDSQESRDAQKGLLSRLQQQYSDYMASLLEVRSTLTNAVATQSQHFLESTREVIRSNIRIYDIVFQIHQYIFSVPQQVQRSQPIYFTDAFGKEAPFHLEFVYSAVVLEDWLKRRFETVGRAKIENGEFALEDAKTKRQVDLSDEWHTQFYPGMHVNMDMVYRLRKDWLQNCPSCRHECASDADQDIKRISNSIKDTWEAEPQLSYGLGQKRKFGNTATAEEVYQEEPQPKRNCIEDEKAQMQHFRRFRFLENDVYDQENISPSDELEAPTVFSVNDIVLARWKSGDKAFYPAIIIARYGPSTAPFYVVKFQRNDLKETLRAKDISPVKPRLRPTPSPPLDESDSDDDKPIPSSGDAVLISLLGGGKALEVARTAAAELLASNDDMSDGSEIDMEVLPIMGKDGRSIVLEALVAGGLNAVKLNAAHAGSR